MKQLFQNLKTGAVSVMDVPAPMPRKGHLVIQSTRTLVSAGTERMLSDFGRAGWIGKARQQPDKVRQVIDKIKTDGIKPTLESVFTKLDEPLPLGYSNVGVIRAVGEGVSRFSLGDRVVSNGPHAEVVSVPENLCVKVPGEVSDGSAAFTVLSAVALNGIRLLEADLGSRVAVMGLGLIGLLSVQILKAAGCRVIGFDFDSGRVEQARGFGAEAWVLNQDLDPVRAAVAFSDGAGVDGVLITASTKSNDPIHQAPQMCRKRGKVVLVGVVGLELSRADFYEKEITFQVSCSYGPGRYDPNYERRGLDYPIGFVRWTEERNFEAVLQLMKEGKLSTERLVTSSLPFEGVEAEYTRLLDDPSQLGIILEYGGAEAALSRTVTRERAAGVSAGRPVIGIIGAGSFAKGVLMPALRRLGVEIRAVCTAGGSSSARAAEKFDVAYNTTDHRRILEDEDVSAVVIGTRHDTHARLVVEALDAGKHVMVEKPLALSMEEIEAVREAVERHPDLILAVGFNRRFSPCAARAKKLLEGRQGPLSSVMVVNAGEVAGTSWVLDPGEGGGRIVGEGCHFIDLLRFLTGSSIETVSSVLDGANRSATITLRFKDGSMGTIHYLSSGHRSVPKERLEMFFDGKVLFLDNFRRLTGYGFKGFSKFSERAQNKGHEEELRSFLAAIKGDAPFGISVEEIFEVSRAAVLAAGGRADIL